MGYNQRGNTVAIAFVDTGIDYTHPDLANNIWTNPGEVCNGDGIDHDGNGLKNHCRGWDFTTCAEFNAADPSKCDTPKRPGNDPIDDNGHGTRVAGIAGAQGNNTIGVSVLMWHVQLMALQILNKDGSGNIADEIAAIQYAIGEGARVINASFAGAAFSRPEQEAVVSTITADVLVVAAAGNGGGDFCETAEGNNYDVSPCYPANYNLPNIIAVAATDENDNLAPFTNFGPKSVHVAAPGVDILSTFPVALNPSDMSLSQGRRCLPLMYQLLQDCSKAITRISSIPRFARPFCGVLILCRPSRGGC